MCRIPHVGRRAWAWPLREMQQDKSCGGRQRWLRKSGRVSPWSGEKRWLLLEVLQAGGERRQATVICIRQTVAIQGRYIVKYVAMRPCQVVGETLANGDRPAVGQEIYITIVAVVPSFRIRTRYVLGSVRELVHRPREGRSTR